eukprot:2387928-Amphidinium_carterae.1
MVKGRKEDPSLKPKMCQFQIVGRAAPTTKRPTPKIYRTGNLQQGNEVFATRNLRFSVQSASDDCSDFIATNEMLRQSVDERQKRKT